MAGRGARQRPRRDQAIVGLRARLAVLAGRFGGFGVDGDELGNLHAARQSLADRDPLVGEVTDAFRVRAVTVRGERQDRAIAASAAPRVAGEAAGLHRLRSRARRAEAGGLGAGKVERDREREGLAEIDLERPAPCFESHHRHRAIIVKPWNPTGGLPV